MATKTTQPAIPTKEVKRMTKSEWIAAIAQAADLDKKSVSLVLDSIRDILVEQLSEHGPGECILPGMFKFKATKKPATQDRPGVNPFTKEPTVIKGKPASQKVRISALKAFKDLVEG